MKKRELMVISVVLLLVFILTLSGCQNIGNIGGGGLSSITNLVKKKDSEFSSKLVSLSLQPKPTTKDKIRSGESFGVISVLTNNLEQPVSGRVCLSDRISDEFGGIPSDFCEAFDIEAKNEAGPKQTTVFANDIFTYNIPDDFGNIQIVANLFYGGSMVGKIKKVCIKPSILTKSDCLNDETFGGGTLDFSSGPLIVTNARKELTEQQGDVLMRLFITLKKLSGVEIINPSLVNSAGLEENIEDNEAIINAEYVGVGSFICDEDNKVKIIKGSTEVECIGRFKVSEVVESPIAISLNYGVKQIVNIGTFNLVAQKEAEKI